MQAPSLFVVLSFVVLAMLSIPVVNAEPHADQAAQQPNRPARVRQTIYRTPQVTVTVAAPTVP